jgi:hypothetical protein
MLELHPGHSLVQLQNPGISIGNQHSALSSQRLLPMRSLQKRKGHRLGPHRLVLGRLHRQAEFAALRPHAEDDFQRL